MSAPVVCLLRNAMRRKPVASLALVVQRIGDGGHDTQLLDVRCVGIAVVNLKLTLSGRLDLA